MRFRGISYLLLAGLLLLSPPLRAQDAADGAPTLDERSRLEIKSRLGQFQDNLDRLHAACKARLPISADVPITIGYLKILDVRLKGLDQNLKSLDIRWNNYYPLQQWDISQDEELLSVVEKFELMRQEATDSLEVRKQMLQSLYAFADATTYFESLDSTYNSIGKRAFQLSLTQKTAPLLEKQKKKEQLLFATVQEKFDKAKEAAQFHLVSDQRMEALEDSYASIKNKSDAIQAMQYKPLIQRIKDYLLGLAAVAVLLMFVNMLRSRIKAAKDARENLKKYKESLKLNGADKEYPTI